MNLYILTAPINTGKSTLLKSWIETQPDDFFGFISIHERHGTKETPRTLFILPQRNSIEFESEDGEIEVGKFKFLNAAFQKGIESLKSASPSSTVIVDEIGKLELQNKGFEPSLTEVLNEIQVDTLIVVVRLSLLNQVIEKYPILKNAKINQGPWMGEIAKVNGLVLGGGESKRMGEPKFLLNYTGVPQYKQVQRMLQEVIDGEVFINVPLIHSDEIEEANLLIDAPEFSEKGPISGLLTAVSQYPNTSWLVVGVDYPKLTVNQLNELYTAHQVSKRSVCFKDPESNVIEPVVAIYSSQDLIELKQYFYDGNESLRRFLKRINCLKLPLTEETAVSITSVDHPFEVDIIKLIP